MVLGMLLPGLAFVSQQTEWRARWMRVGTALFGVTASIDVPPLRWDTLVDHSFQNGAEAWLARKIGAPRVWLIKLSNGVSYAFGHSPAPSVVIGRGRMLYEAPYVEDWCRRPQGDMAALAAQVADVQAAVRARGKGFVLLISPSKAAILPETLPADCRAAPGPRNYDRLLPLLRDKGVVTVDGHALLAALERQEPWPVFGRDGVHWNLVGAGAAVQAVFAALEPQLGRALPRLRQTGATVDRTPLADEGDLGLLLNLPFSLRPVSPHPVFAVDRPGPPPKLLVVGTSFNWQPLRLMQQEGLIDRTTFLYYFSSTVRYAGKTVEMPASFGQSGGDAESSLPDALAEADAVVLEVNEATLMSGYVTRLREALGRL